ncbi:MAG: UDP-N-acetylmuramyl-tripeptide synthetase [Candidatus Kerfeldbacteria bacterium]|nr:UDP-N-acetylmuramyl-tripeptide synthetase [Candidatus Kerfeldbacteria bacterium]
MRRLLRRFIPKSALAAYHGLVARAGAAVFRHPSRRLTVIGITGTSGKTTVGILLQAILERADIPSALASSAVFAVRNRQAVNDTKMTMLGRWRLQRFLRSALKAGCTHVIVETTSEGLAQNRHLGIDYDVAALTNLSPEHLESHGSFAAYQSAKERLFHILTLTARKPGVPKVIVVNADDEAAPSFLRHAADKYVTFTLQGTTHAQAESVTATSIKLSPAGSTFVLTANSGSARVELGLLGRMNVENALAASAVAYALGLPVETIADGLGTVRAIPGRLEFFRAGGVTVIVDYAFHPKAMEELYAVVESLPHRNILHVLGGTGGGRDRARRPVLGRIAGERAQTVIVTNEDPYDEDPYSIMDDVLSGVIEIGDKHLGENVFRILDRRAAIAQAVTLAHDGDVILVTGKGSEQAIVVGGGKKVPWDDREVVKACLTERFGEIQ